jgi:spore maturation protein CgeB
MVPHTLLEISKFIIYEFFHNFIRIRDSSVGIATSWTFKVRFPVSAWDCSLPYSTNICSRANQSAMKRVPGALSLAVKPQRS